MPIPRGVAVGVQGVPYSQCLACQHIYNISAVLVNIVVLIRLNESPLCHQVVLQQTMFVSKLGLCNPPIIFSSFASTCPLCTTSRVSGS